MSLTPGSRLGPYEIVAAIGAGGMGEVYRATDSNLKRQVAIKVLPATVAGDPDRLARFRREAEVLASLNHPGIAAIYGFEDSGSTHALVMELVEGEDLAQRLTRGPIPLDDALKIARQIADALEAAHEQGIIHRDLKPANVKVREDGTVKVLDFGLAKAMEPAGAAALSSSASMSPTITTPAMTAAGMILGTAAYMAPEQARGRAVDRRADIWAFGVVLYEMLTGERLFQGEDLTETLASVVKEQPDLSKAPRQVQRLLRKCLEKDPRKRLRDVVDAWDLINDEAVATPAPAGGRGRSRLAWGIAAVLAITSAALAFTLLSRAPVQSSERRHLSVPLPEDSVTGSFALSPDGRSVVMNYAGGLAIRSLETGEQRALAGTDGARAPFWSPDSRNVAFVSFADRTLKTITASGGVPQVLCGDVDSAGGGTWNRAGTILFATRTVLMRVSAPGSECTKVGTPAPAGSAPALPVFLPDGEHFLYGQAGVGSQRGLFVASLANPAGKRLLADFSSALFAPDAPGSSRGRLLFVREQTLMAQSFDAASLTLSGDPVVVAKRVDFTNTAPQIAASVADDGTLMYMTNTHVDRQMIWYDRFGAEVGRAASTGTGPAALALSPDGKRVTFQRPDALGTFSLLVQDFERSQEIRLPAPQLGFGAAVWAPDGQRLAVSGGQSLEEAGIWAIDTSGGQRRLILPSNTRPAVSDWSRDGRWLLYTEQDPKTGADIWVLPIRDGAAAGKPVPLVRTPALESQAQLSPDGKWLAYIVVEGNVWQIVIRPFNGDRPLGDARWPVSDAKNRTREPRWRADGKELFYVEIPPDASQIYRVMAVPIGGGPNPVGSPKALFDFRTVGTVPQANYFAYAPAPDGQRFLADAFASAAKPTLEVILNWAQTK